MKMYGTNGNPGIATYLEEQGERRRKRDSRTMKRIAQAFAPYKFQVILVILAIVTTTTLGLVNPFMISFIFDDAIGKGNVELLVIFVSIMLVTPVITGLISVGQVYLNQLIGQNVMRDFRNKLYSHLQDMSLNFFTLTRTGEIQSRLSNDVNGLQAIATNAGTGIITNISIVLSTIIGMLLLSPLLTLISLGLLPIFLWITYKVGNVRRMTSRRTQESMATLTAMMQETLSVSGILLVKIFGRQKYAWERFEKESQRLTDLEIRQQLIGRWFFMLVNIFFAAMPLIVYLVAGLQIIQHPGNAAITLGKIVAFTTLQSRLYSPLGQLLAIQIEIQGALALFDRIFEYMDMQIDIKDKPEALRLKSQEVRGKIAFKNVTFSYRRDSLAGLEDLHTSNKAGKQREKISLPALSVSPADDEDMTLLPALSNISFTIKPGQLVALVGPSGAGKTTITYLVPRLYDVESGVVEIDGINVKDIALASLGEIVGMVTQETYLLHASVRENLLYARDDATEEEMIAAARAAAIHERIMELDKGYDTIVGERGYRLSGGEKQRIAIARVILKNPRILILDEATSALDTHSERLIQSALEPLMKDRTTLAIAHRLSTILAADMILVVDKGCIIERGTHAELLELNGLYMRLYNEQFAKETIEEIPS